MSLPVLVVTRVSPIPVRSMPVRAPYLPPLLKASAVVRNASIVICGPPSWPRTMSATRFVEREPNTSLAGAR